MEITRLSNTYVVRRIEEQDVSEVFRLCGRNPQFYHYCPPAVTIEGIKADMHMLPPNKTMDDKYYMGFYHQGQLIAVMDLILGYPNEETAFIGFFIMNADFQGKGIGSQIIEDVCTYLKNSFFFVRLTYVKGNEQSEHFWIKNHFRRTGVTTRTKDYEMIVMQRAL